MITLCLAREPALLVERLCADLDRPYASPVAHAFDAATIIIPGRILQGLLTARIAQRAGIAANLRFLFLEELVEELLAASPGNRLLRRFDLTNLLFAAVQDGTAPDAVQSYLGRGTLDEAHRDHKAFQLAHHLSRIFRDYGHARPEMVRAWQEGLPTLAGARSSTRTTEDWQRSLWAMLFAPGGARDRLAGATGIRWLRLDEVGPHLDSSGSRPPERLHAFGFEHLSAAHRSFLAWLSPRTHLRVYTASPFLSAADPGTASPGARLAHRMGGPGRLNLTALATLGGQPTTLGSEGIALPDEASIRILACPGIRREVEIVAGEIWNLVASADPDARLLRFKNIAVALADGGSRDAYTSAIHSVFGDAHRIPYNMLDAASPTARRVFEVVRLLIDLPLARIELSTVLPLLTHPLLAARFHEADVDAWRRWTRETGVFFGADAADNAGTYVQQDVYNFDQSLRRLALGAFLTGQRSGDERTFEHRGMAYLPEEIAQESVPHAAQFVTLVRSLLADARFAATERCSLVDWSRLVTRQLAMYFDGETAAEKRALAMTVKSVADLAQHDLDGRPVPYRVLHGLLTKELEQLATGRGSWLSPGVTIGSVESLRLLPFEVVFVCGLGEGLFPATDHVDPLDLRLAEDAPAPDDVLLRDQDRYHFLELATAARRRLYMSFVARDPLSGSDLEPSSAIHELHDCVHPDHTLRIHDRKKPCPLVHFHPLRRFDEPEERAGHQPEAQREQLARRHGKAARDSGLVSSSAPDLRSLDPAVCQALGLAPLPALSGPADVDVRTVTLNALREFLECPLQGWARNVMGLRTEDGEEDETTRGEILFTAAPAQTTLLRRAFVETLASAGAGLPDFAPAYERLFTAAELSGIAPTGAYREREREAHRATLAGWYANLALWGDHRESDGRHRRLDSVRFGRADEHERVARPRDALVLPLVGPDGAKIPVEVHGRTQPLLPDERTSFILVDRAEARHADFLRGFIDALVLTLAGRPGPAGHTVVVLPSTPVADRVELPHQQYATLTTPEARRYLLALVNDLLFGDNRVLFPHEAVFKHLENGGSGSLTRIIREMRDKALNDTEGKRGFSSTRGPLPNPLDLEPPGNDRAAASLLEQRFWLYRKVAGI